MLDLTKRLDHLTGLRGIAAYTVLIGHAIDAAMATSIPHAVAGMAVQLAYFGMSAFFVLSGFVIHYNYLDTFKSNSFIEACRLFFIARFARLYPLYALTIVLNFFFVPAIFFGRPGALAAYVTMTASWFNLEKLIYPPGWSISSEWFFYFVFALIAPIVSRSRANPRWLLLTLFVGVPIFFLFINSLSASVYPFLETLFFHDQAASAPIDVWLWYYAPYVRIMEFFFGMLASAIYLRSGSKLALLSVAGSVLEVVAIGWCVGVIFIGGAFTATPFGPLSSNFTFAPPLSPSL